MPTNDRWASNDLLQDDAAAATYPAVPAVAGLELTHRPSRVEGVIIAFTQGERVVLRDQDGNLHEFKPHPGVLLSRGKPVRLVTAPADSSDVPTLTPSGSIDAGPVRARSAQASRIWVEGIHDAELIEAIWGDDLRVEGIVVEPMHGVDEMLDMIADFQPQGDRRLGILLDHMMPGTKEARLAVQVTDPNVLVLGHPYVDIWAAVRPQLVGIESWPEIPRGTPWKEGIISAMGADGDPGVFWRQILNRVSTYRDVETPLINAVEQLIDFVTGV